MSRFAMLTLACLSASAALVEASAFPAAHVQNVKREVWTNTTTSSSSMGGATSTSASVASSSVSVAIVPAPTVGAALTLANGVSWKSAGCFGASAGFASAFILGNATLPLTLDSCLTACGPAEFTALTQTQCFCSNPATSSIDSLGLVELPASECKVPSAAKVQNRQVAPVGAITIFINTSNNVGTPASSSSASSTSSAAAGIVTVTGAGTTTFSTTIISPGSVYFTLITNVYIDINHLGLPVNMTYQVPYSQAYCGCAADTIVACPTSIPMTTITKACNACGAATPSVTVTVPVAVATGSCSNGSCATGVNNAVVKATTTCSGNTCAVATSTGVVRFTGAANVNGGSVAGVLGGFAAAAVGALIVL